MVNGRDKDEAKEWKHSGEKEMVLAVNNPSFHQCSMLKFLLDTGCDRTRSTKVLFHHWLVGNL
eukprot:182467-Pelagomonas_calceolata.AAC.1